MRLISLSQLKQMIFWSHAIQQDIRNINQHLSDLQFWKNIIEIEGTQKIVSHAGTKVEFVESVSLYFGHFSGRGFLF